MSPGYAAGGCSLEAYSETCRDTFKIEHFAKIAENPLLLNSEKEIL